MYRMFPSPPSIELDTLRIREGRKHFKHGFADLPAFAKHQLGL
jgi:hypothetical protein